MKQQEYSTDQEYKDNKKNVAELVTHWESQWDAANRAYKKWALRFRIRTLYQYYEGYQHMLEGVDEFNRPYVCNMIYSTIEQKLPSMLFDSPYFNIRPRPYGDEFDFDQAIPQAQLKEDALNFVIGEKGFSLDEKHELAILDAFFGFGILEVDYSKNPILNPSLTTKEKDPLKSVYCKHIPFDQFRVSAVANWDLTMGRWWGYYEFVPYESLSKYPGIELPGYTSDDVLGLDGVAEGKIMVGDDSEQDICPPNHVKVVKIWDFETKKFLLMCSNAQNTSDKLLEYEDFEYSPISTLRFSKRRKGWYPLPPVWNWLSPQDEINDIRQAQRIHRKRFTRKYAVMDNAIEEEELDKFLYGPDGTVFKVKRPVNEAVQAVANAPQDTSNAESLVVSYEDFNRVSGTSDEQHQVPSGGNRTTATQAQITNNRAQIRESKDTLRVGSFLNDFAKNTMRAIGKAPGSFWAQVRVPEGLLDELRKIQKVWKKIPSSIFKEEDYDVDIAVSSISPVYQQQDKSNFMEFLALITQYEILSMSPSLLREAAYRVGYKNSSVLNQFQQLAQLAALGRLTQAKQQIQPVGTRGQQPTAPGQLPSQQVEASTPNLQDQIMNTIFNRQGVQQ